MTNQFHPGSDTPPFSVEPEPTLAGYPPPAVPAFRPMAPIPTGSPMWAAPRPGPMPDVPREYQQLLRGPRHRWWRPLLALLLAALLAVVLLLLAFVPVVLVAAAASVSEPLRWSALEVIKVDDLGPAGFLYVNLSLIALIPTAGLSIWIAHRVRPRYLASVRGHIRWRWLLRCVVVVVPVWAVYLGLSVLDEPAASARPAHWGLLLLMVVLLTPLQAAGEEYLFRGWVMQNVGSWFRSPIVGLVAGLVVSVTVFSAAHGSPDIWVLGSLGVFALTAGLATWRTGGLEAGIVIHAVNNVGVFFMVILLGQWKSAFVGADTTGVPSDVLIALLVHAVALALILWQAKKTGLQRLYQPAAEALTGTLSPQPAGSDVGFAGQGPADGRQSRPREWPGEQPVGHGQGRNPQLGADPRR
jgi:membrane protease YdiL (CAAX protease family)